MQDLFQTDLSGAQVITLYLLTEVNLQLRPRLLALKPGTRIVSHDWGMGDWQPDASITLDVPDKAIGRDKRSTVYLWVVPAAVHGLWCSTGGQRQGQQAQHGQQAQLTITQRFQTFSATLQAAGSNAPLAVIDGRVTADGLHQGDDPRGATLLFQVQGDALQLQRANPATMAYEQRRFVRAGPQGCG